MLISMEVEKLNAFEGRDLMQYVSYLWGKESLVKE